LTHWPTLKHQARTLKNKTTFTPASYRQKLKQHSKIESDKSFFSK